MSDINIFDNESIERISILCSVVGERSAFLFFFCRMFSRRNAEASLRLSFRESIPQVPVFSVKVANRPLAAELGSGTQNGEEESETGNRGQLILRYKKRAGATIVFEGRQRTANLSSTGNLTSSRCG